MKFNGLITVVLLLVFSATLVLLARHGGTWQWQMGYADLLPDSAKRVLQQQSQLRIDVFAAEDDPLSDTIRKFLSPITDYAKHIEVSHHHPEQAQELMNRLEIQTIGAMLVETDKGKFVLDSLSYEQFFNHLKRLDNQHDDWLLLLQGFGGAEYQSKTDEGYGKWLKSLQQAGYKVAIMDWKKDLLLPKNIKALVLNRPQQTLSAEAVNWLQKQISNGTALWWLTEPKQAHQQAQLSLLFDVMPTETYHQGRLLIKDFPSHLITNNFERSLDLFGVMSFIGGGDGVWVDAKGKKLATAQQLGNARLLLTGDSDFLNNRLLHSGGNLEMSYRLVDWLLGIDQRIDLPDFINQYSRLDYSKQQVLLHSGVMLLLFPGLLLLIAARQWYKNKQR